MLIDDVEYVIFRYPDPAAAGQFMLDFGLLDLEQKGDSLYTRSYGDAPFSYVTSKGDAAFVGIGFRVASREALDEQAPSSVPALWNAPVQEAASTLSAAIRTAVGSNSYSERCAPRLFLPAGGAPIMWNDAHARNRLGTFQRPVYGPSHIQRLGHFALLTPSPQQMIA
jgi:hypothetical protein